VKWFPRRRRFTLGTYVAPAQHEATIEEMVDDGVLIAAAAVRLAVKNLIILRSARDHADYSPERVKAAVREELENLAMEKDADAARLRDVGRRAAERDGQPLHHDDYRSVDTELLTKRAEVSERLATRLRELGGDAEFCGALVDRARHDAWEEIAASITAQARLSSRAHDADYDRERGGRMLALLGDLADLENRER
jgi:hypothetical protein